MENQSALTENPESIFAPAGFNIAAAFPVTDELVRKVARERWRRRAQSLASKPGILLCIAAGLIGIALAARPGKF